MLNTVTTEIGNRDRAALVFFGLKFLRARTCSEILDSGTDFAKALFAGVPNDRSHKPLFDCDCASELYAPVLEDGVSLKRSIRKGYPVAGTAGRLKNKVIAGDFRPTDGSPALLISFRSLVNGSA